MATAASSRTTPPRRAPSTHTMPTANSIARGATARSAVSPKVGASVNGVHRRSSTSRSSLASGYEGETREALTAALKRETEEKEGLLLRVQNKEQTISELTSENDNLGTSLNAAESRLAELYADQARIEEETAARLELVDRLRAQVHELEKEKRDILRRYNEQTATFDAERQSFYDNEQHLKSRIQSLIQARKTVEVQVPVSRENDSENDPVSEIFEHPQEQAQAHVPEMSQVEPDENTEPAEMTALRLELSTLSTSYSSLQNTVQHLSSQLLDLKRVNNQLQEENESYNILLRERTITGQFDIRRTVGTKGSNDGSDDDDDDDDDDEGVDQVDITDHGSLRSIEKTTLDPVDELAEDMDSGVYGENPDGGVDDTSSTRSVHERDRSHRQGRGGRRNAATSRSPAPKGESLANLPVAGPGLDLAAELGRAENSAILDGGVDPMDTRDHSIINPKNKRSKRAAGDRNVSGGKPEPSNDIDALRNEVKSLKDANKALSLYASKIIDRIIAEEGFEHVLAADYDKSNPSSPAKPKQSPKIPSSVDNSPKKPRPQSAIFRRPFAGSDTAQPAQGVIPTSPMTNSPQAIPSEQTATTKIQRRSLSFDWSPFSMFGSAEKKPEPNPNLRPLTLRPGSTSIVGARKLDTHEDEEDRKERERMNAVLKLMGIEKPETPTIASPIIKDSVSSGGTPSPQVTEPTSPKPQASRFSFFRSKSSTSDNSSTKSGNSGNAGQAANANLTQEALERSEAESSLAALDEREKVLSAEIAKGANGGFTELPSRRQRGEEWRSRRSKRSGESGSGSTVWSAGMSTHREADSEDEQTRS